MTTSPERGLPLRVQIKREGQDIGWAREAHELQVQGGHFFIADQGEGEIGERGGEKGVGGFQMFAEIGRKEMRTSNIEHRTTNIEVGG